MFTLSEELAAKVEADPPDLVEVFLDPGYDSAFTSSAPELMLLYSHVLIPAYTRISGRF
jgi:hypothetical protein